MTLGQHRVGLAPEQHSEDQSDLAAPAERAVARAKHRAGISRPAARHTPRQSCATQRLEAGTDVRVIQALHGHAKLKTTARCAHVATKTIRSTVGPTPLKVISAIEA
ncbi:tyrosine-type recombinase/integrase [Albidovulum sediminicola]|uniref:tyrosine-type recombinase/integrase n=1 Tax=Albidovulum sediminicola TaxID=2984331 RepID=UPI003991C493